MKPKPVLAALGVACFKSVASAAAVDTVNSLDELPYDSSDNHLASHIFAYTSSCIQIVENSPVQDGIFSHKFYVLEGTAEEDVFGHLDSSVECKVACLEKGTPRSLVARPMPHRYWIDGMVDRGDGTVTDEISLFDFVTSDGCGMVEYGFINYLDRPVHVYWIDDSNNQRVFEYTLKTGTDNFSMTFINHQFEVYDDLPHEDKLKNEILYKLTVENNGYTSVGINSHGDRSSFKKRVMDKVEFASHDEWIRQARVKRTFSPLGFETGRLPNDLFASMSAYYYNNRFPPHINLEDWNSSEGIFVNWWQTDVMFVQIAPLLSAIWQYRLKELVERWVGFELETTDMYGMRAYTKGARLVTHVDRVTTHAASLIVNIAQENMERPWTVEINDHAHRLHEVVMEPGDIVYYESAKALHGRNTPLQGGKYINLFTHYRPVDDPKWYQKENPEGAPEPLIDVGECKLVGRYDEYSKGAVKCDNDAVGLHLSPMMFNLGDYRYPTTISGGDDLFRWWKLTSPKDAFEALQDREENEEVIASQDEL